MRNTFSGSFAGLRLASPWKCITREMCSSVNRPSVAACCGRLEGAGELRIERSQVAHKVLHDPGAVRHRPRELFLAQRAAESLELLAVPADGIDDAGDGLAAGHGAPSFQLQLARTVYTTRVR